MFARLKETLKDWLVEHERLYWYIIIGLAVFAFGFITMMGMAKLEKANAAETNNGVYYPDLLTDVNLGSYETQVKDVLNQYPYIGICKKYGLNEYWFHFFDGSTEFTFFPFGETESNAGMRCQYIVVVSNGAVTQCYTSAYASMTVDRSTNNGFQLVGTNFSIGYRSSENGKAWHTAFVDSLQPRTNNLVHPNDYVPDPEYTSSAPYLRDVTYSYVNSFWLDGNDDFEASSFRYSFDVTGGDSGYANRTAKLSGYVCLPSKSYIDKAVELYEGGRSTLEEYYSLISGEQFSLWLKSIDVGDGSTFKKWYFSLDVDFDTLLDFSITNEQLYKLVEECNNVDLREYYGISNYAYIDSLLKGHMWIHRLDGVVYTTYSDSVVYGNCTSFVISTYLKEPVIVYGNSDPLFYGPPVDFVGPMLPDSDVNSNIDMAYKEALENAKKEYESLYGEMEGYYDIQGAFGDLSGSDLWTGFRSLADGLASMAPATRAIASLSGAVLAFMPLQVTGIMSFTLLAICIIAIIKAIRG